MQSASPDNAVAPRREITQVSSAIGRDAYALPSMIVAHSFSGRPLPLGLDRPFELRGGELLAPDGLALQLPLSWVPSLTGHVAAACRRQSDEGRPWFSMRPTALSGARGLGRTHMARTIARIAGVPFTSFDVAGPQGPANVVSRSRSPDVALPSAIVSAIAASGCANPVVLVTGADDAAPDTAEALASMIAPETAPRWVEEGLEAIIDLSQVTWLIQTADASDLPPSFPADLNVVQLVRPGGIQRALLALSVVAEMAADLQLPANRFVQIADAVVDYVRLDGSPSVMELHRIILDAVLEFERDRERPDGFQTPQRRKPGPPSPSTRGERR